MPRPSGLPRAVGPRERFKLGCDGTRLVCLKLVCLQCGEWPGAEKSAPDKGSSKQVRLKTQASSRTCQEQGLGARAGRRWGLGGLVPSQGHLGIEELGWGLKTGTQSLIPASAQGHWGAGSSFLSQGQGKSEGKGQHWAWGRGWGCSLGLGSPEGPAGTWRAGSELTQSRAWASVGRLATLAGGRDTPAGGRDRPAGGVSSVLLHQGTRARCAEAGLLETLRPGSEDTEAPQGVGPPRLQVKLSMLCPAEDSQGGAFPGRSWRATRRRRHPSVIRGQQGAQRLKRPHGPEADTKVLRREGRGTRRPARDCPLGGAAPTFCREHLNLSCWVFGSQEEQLSRANLNTSQGLLGALGAPGRGASGGVGRDSSRSWWPPVSLLLSAQVSSSPPPGKGGAAITSQTYRSSLSSTRTTGTCSFQSQLQNLQKVLLAQLGPGRYPSATTRVGPPSLTPRF